jgi:hypothetical protein
MLPVIRELKIFQPFLFKCMYEGIDWSISLASQFLLFSVDLNLGNTGDLLLTGFFAGIVGDLVSTAHSFPNILL